MFHPRPATDSNHRQLLLFTSTQSLFPLHCTLSCCFSPTPPHPRPPAPRTLTLLLYEPWSTLQSAVSVHSRTNYVVTGVLFRGLSQKTVGEAAVSTELRNALVVQLELLPDDAECYSHTRTLVLSLVITDL